MPKTQLIPMFNQDFEIYHINTIMESYQWLKKHNEQAENISNVEALFELHSHDVMEIFVFLDGECDFFCEGITYTLSPGDVVVIPPLAVHKALVRNPETYKRCIIYINPNLLSDFEYSSPTLLKNRDLQKKQDSNFFHIHTKKFQEIVSLLKELIEKIEENKENSHFTLRYLLFQVLQIVFDPTSSTPGQNIKKELDHRLVSIMEYIEANLTDPDLSLEKMAKHFHLSKYYFSHFFKGRMEMPFYRYVILKRLSLAVTMIKENKHSIEQIANKCGFADYSSFYRLFKKEYNISPKNLQKDIK